jgi:hypothetical protein
MVLPFGFSFQPAALGWGQDNNSTIAHRCSASRTLERGFVSESVGASVSRGEGGSAVGSLSDMCGRVKSQYALHHSRWNINSAGD